MKDKKNKEQYNKKANKQNKNVNLKADYKWIITITLTAFLIRKLIS